MNSPVRFFVPLFLCFVGGGLGAQTSEVFRFPLSAETLPRYTAVCDTLAGHPVVKGSFVQKKTIRRLNRSLLSGGFFIIDAELGIVWDTRSPFPSIMAVGRDYLIQSVPGGAKTKLNAAGNETFLRFSDTISAVFSGNVQKLLDNFENYFTESGGSWTLGLIPSERTIRSFAARITMSGDSVIRSVTLYEQNGDTIQYELSDHGFPENLGSDERALFFE
jgi:hypothetical protein